MISTLLVIVYLWAGFGGTITADLAFASRKDCDRFMKEVRGYSIRHEVLRPCSGVPEPEPPAPVSEPESTERPQS